MLWSRKVRQLTISFRDLARSNLWDGWRVGSVTGQSASGVHSHNAYSFPSNTFIHGTRNSKGQLELGFLLDSKPFLKSRQMVYVDKSGNWGSSPLAQNILVFARQLWKCAFLIKVQPLFACLYAICCLQPTPAIEVSDKAGEFFKRKEPFCWQSAANTSVSKQ